MEYPKAKYEQNNYMLTASAVVRSREQWQQWLRRTRQQSGRQTRLRQAECVPAAFVCSGKGKAKLPISASSGDLEVMAAIGCSGHLLFNQQKCFVAAVHNYTTMTAPQHRFGSPSSGPGQFNRPCGMAVDAVAGHIIVANSSNHQVGGASRQ
jgi:hypothetical protein